MSTTQSQQQRRERECERQERRLEARGRRHPRLGCRPREGVLRARVEARRRLPLRQRLPGRPVHAARLGVLGPIRHEPHVGRARLGPGPLPDRLRHRGCARRAGRPRCRGQRGVFRRRRSVPARRQRSRHGLPDHASYSSFATFSDPDGNGWLLQEITTRLPGRIDAAETAFASTADLASALRRAAAAHGEHEKRIGEADENWPDWYAAYMVAEQAGTELPT